MQQLRNQLKTLDHIGIYEIIFDHSEWVTLWGFKLEKGKKVELHFLTDFQTLNKLLRLSGEEGDEIQMHLVSQMEQGIGNPSILDLEKLCGKPAFFNRIVLEISPTWKAGKEGELTEDKTCLSIDAVYPQPRKDKKSIALQTQYKKSLLHCEELLANAYALYLGYLELGMEEERALEMSELEDDFKFRMAYYAWKMNQKAA